VDAAGRTISPNDALFQIGNLSPADAVAYWKDHGISIAQYYQPADRFWTFQTIETAILGTLALLLLGLTVYWVARRVA
jgi:hypothetical protein